MTCQECEVKLGMGEDAAEHVASCAECRWLAEELRLNSVALRELRAKPRMQWAWVLAAAAALVMAIGVWKSRAVAPPVIAAHQVAPPPLTSEVRMPVVRKHKPTKSARREPAPQPLRVKMFTSDPDVVIYWIVDKKEGIE
jgi:hypothetical protein